MTEHSCIRLNHREKDIQNYAACSVLKHAFFTQSGCWGKLALDPQVQPTEIQVPWADSGGHDVYLTNFLHDFDTNGPWTPG